MGFDVQVLNLLRYAKRHGDFGKTVTIGRQSLHPQGALARASILVGPGYKHSRYGDELLKSHFGSTSVDSIDVSDYESATIVCDLNRPLPPNLSGKFDTVIDTGSLEHIYNVPQALESYSSLCKPGGQILLMLPASNLCGHGFWQFSPELFFSLYSAENGYQSTEVFLAKEGDWDRWFKVKKPRSGKRLQGVSSSRLYVLVRTVLARSDFSHSNVQQSDYVPRWAGDGKERKGRLVKRIFKENSIARNLLRYAFFYSLHESYRRMRKSRFRRLNASHPLLTSVNLRSLLEPLRPRS